jgi:chemosensory pili system protein ChpA (sensor histidine kinase/response regulator)
MSSTPSTMAENEPGLNDLGPLAWVLDELRKSLDGATKAMHRFVRDAEMARGSELSELDTSHLRVARQQLHQAVGALEMVGMPAPAKLLHAMESAVQRFLQRPEHCSNDAATRIERASFALAEYLEGVLKGKNASSVALFPQYRAVMELASAERIHPADLWQQEWRWLPVVLNDDATALPYAPKVRALLDQAVLKIVKSADKGAAAKLSQVCMGLAAAQSNLESHSFWAIAAGYFEAVALSLLNADIYTKRTASRILQQYAALAKGGSGPSERLAQDLVFFCAQAQAAPGATAPALTSVRAAYGLSDSAPVDYEAEQFGRFDPAQLVLARKRIASAAETWSALAGGDTNRLKLAGEQFAAVAESILKLHPKSSALSQALTNVVDASVRSNTAPVPAVAMEVATSILYLEAAYDDLDPTDDQMVERCTRLAQRLELVRSGAEPEPLESWMEELYRRVSDRQTMGSVVDELRSSLGEVENALDQFFRNPTEKSVLRDVPSRLAQMRGVFSVLGLDQPSLATLRMRASVDSFLIDNIDFEAARTGIFEKLGNSLGALGLLIDMLSYQRAMAKKLFVYDEEAGEFKPLMGRQRSTVPAAAPATPKPELAVSSELVMQIPVASAPQTILPAPAPATPEPVPAAPVTTPVAQIDEDEEELQDIFLEEAREVVAAGLVAVRELAVEPSNLAEQTTLRRAFHTLKGSSRMVGLNDFGEAAWSFEQLLNAWLAEQKPASDALISLSGRAMSAFGRWVEAISQGEVADWSAKPFRKASDALRLEGRSEPLNVTGELTEVPSAFAPFEESVAPVSIKEAATAPEDGPDAAVADFAATRLVDAADSVAASDSEPVWLPEPEDAFPDFVATHMTDSLSESTANAGFHIDAGDSLQPDFEATQTFQPEKTQSFQFDKMQAIQAPAVPVQPTSVEMDLGDFDFADLSVDQEPPVAAEDSATAPAFELDFPDVPVAESAPTPVASTEPFELPSFDLAPEPDLPPIAEIETPPAPQAVPTPLAEQQESDEQIKVIGDLRLSIPLYNVFLNEADEWSRRLITELSEWTLELHRPIADSSVALAHSLGGISATVGFSALSQVARALEHALDHVKLHGQGNARHAQVFNAAAEDIRRLLHQFAAGFLKAGDPQVLQDLQDIIASEFAEPILEVPDPTDEVASPESNHLPLSVAAAPLKVAEASEHDIDAIDHLDTDLFPIFQEEALELMPALGTALRQWVARPENLGARSEALRVLHTLKGSARLAGALRLGEMSHRMESSIESLGSEGLQSVQLEPLLTRMDALQGTLDALDLAPREDISQPHKTEAEVTTAVVTPAATVAETVPAAVAAPVVEHVSVERVTRAAPRTVAGQTVRVRALLLDRLVNQAGEVMISRSRLDARVVQMRGGLGELSGNLERLRQQLRDVEVQAESQMQSRMAHTKDDGQAFDPLEFDRFTRVQELTRMMAESVNDVATVQRNLQRTLEGAEDDLIAQGRQARELQRDLLRTRMVEFESISERLYGVVRQAGKECAKPVKLAIVGGSIEMDRGVLDRMTPAFEHILRNAVAHGIEEADVRAAAGKTPVGSITIALHQEGNDMAVSFSDDGGGLHLDKIRAKAIASKLITADETLSDEAAAKLLFAPGFTTASAVTEIAGRGIGMDVVLSELNSLGGKVETLTVAGKGTTFRLVLPLTTAVTQVVMLRVGELNIGVPSNLIETVLRAPLQSIQLAYTRGVYDFAGQDVPFFWGGALLQVSGKSQEVPTRNQPVAVFRSAGQRLALHVDEVLGNREVVVKNLGPQLARLPGLAGMSVLASGAVVLIYNPVALATFYGDAARALTKASEATPGSVTRPSAQTSTAIALAPLVLVVDDSITVRRVTQRLLKREGFRVALANDGLHALEVLAQEKPDVVLSDIEMPRMDGFDLVRNIRNDVNLRDLPVIMITSRIAEKHREHAMELGVDHYLGKPYSEDELLALIRSYCAVVNED